MHVPVSDRERRPGLTAREAYHEDIPDHEDHSCEEDGYIVVSVIHFLDRPFDSGLIREGLHSMINTDAWDIGGNETASNEYSPWRERRSR
jgi:hypothetical protein